jgi:hypothetical protein
LRSERGPWGDASRVLMTLFLDLEDFVHDHSSHDSLTTDATQPARNG